MDLLSSKLFLVLLAHACVVIGAYQPDQIIPKIASNEEQTDDTWDGWFKPPDLSHGFFDVQFSPNGDVSVDYVEPEMTNVKLQSVFKEDYDDDKLSADDYEYKPTSHSSKETEEEEEEETEPTDYNEITTYDDIKDTDLYPRSDAFARDASASEEDEEEKDEETEPTADHNDIIQSKKAELLPPRSFGDKDWEEENVDWKFAVDFYEPTLEEMEFAYDEAELEAKEMKEIEKNVEESEVEFYKEIDVLPRSSGSVEVRFLPLLIWILGCIAAVSAFVLGWYLIRSRSSSTGTSNPRGEAEDGRAGYRRLQSDSQSYLITSWDENGTKSGKSSSMIIEI